MCLRRALFIVGCLIGVLYLLRHPHNAAHAAMSIMRVLAHLADALGRFVSGLDDALTVTVASSPTWPH